MGSRTPCLATSNEDPVLEDEIPTSSITYCIPHTLHCFYSNRITHVIRSYPHYKYIYIYIHLPSFNIQTLALACTLMYSSSIQVHTIHMQHSHQTCTHTHIIHTVLVFLHSLRYSNSSRLYLHPSITKGPSF